jgi:hypothetical protein
MPVVQERLGTVDLRSFDRGVVETLGGVVSVINNCPNYYVAVEGVDPAAHDPVLPGVPITFAFPEDVFEKYRQPVVVVRRDDISPAMNRWHPTTIEWRAPTSGAPVQATSVGLTTVTGPSKVDEKQQAVPFDISYTITILARHRGAIGQRNQVNLILRHVLKRYPPYAVLGVLDSLDCLRTYDIFMDGVSHLDEVPDVTERVLGFAVTLRVEGELDLNDPTTFNTVTNPLTINTHTL